MMENNTMHTATIVIISMFTTIVLGLAAYGAVRLALDIHNQIFKLELKNPIGVPTQGKYDGDHHGI